MYRNVEFSPYILVTIQTTGRHNICVEGKIIHFAKNKTRYSKTEKQRIDIFYKIYKTIQMNLRKKWIFIENMSSLLQGLDTDYFDYTMLMKI